VPHQYRHCAHGSQCTSGSNGRCCLCKQPPNRLYSFIDDSFSDFCSHCRDYWCSLSQRKLFPPGCSHKSSNQCQKQHSTVCCLCADMKKGGLSLDARLSAYCPPCREPWILSPLTRMPGLWFPFPFPECSHATTTRCGQIRLGECCCCQDKVTKKISLQERVQNYCTPCSAYWTSQFPRQFPNHWLPFPCHHRASCSSRGASPLCCQCKDTGAKKMTLEARTWSFCLSCRTRINNLSEASRLAELPLSWQPFWDECLHVKGRGCERAKSGKCCICSETKAGTASRRPSRVLPICKRCAGQYSESVKSSVDVEIELETREAMPLPNGMADRGPQRCSPLLWKKGDIISWTQSDPSPPPSPHLNPVPIVKIDASSQDAISKTYPDSADNSTLDLSEKGPIAGFPQLLVPVVNPKKTPDDAASTATAVSPQSSASSSPAPSRPVSSASSVTSHSSRRLAQWAGQPRLATLEEFKRLENATK
jgi:hypothetical protein